MKTDGTMKVKRTREEILAWLAQRSRLFLRWFNGAEQQKRYAIRSAEIHGENNRMEYVALIVERSNPHLDEILSIFDEETAMFDELKP